MEQSPDPRRARHRQATAGALLALALAAAGPGGAVDAPVARAGTEEIAATRAQVRQVQQQLNALGYDAGPVDGQYGRKTRQAILQFERDHDLPTVGLPDAHVRERIAAALRRKRADRAAEDGGELAIYDSEARELAGEPNLVTAADIIRDMGPETLIIKKGEHGALLFTDGAIFSAPAYPLEDIQDPTGAGDAFAGGLAGHLVRANAYDQEALRRGVVYGSVMASFVVENYGPDRLLELGPDDIVERGKSFRQLAAIPSLVSPEKQPA